MLALRIIATVLLGLNVLLKFLVSNRDGINPLSVLLASIPEIFGIVVIWIV